MKQTTIAFKQVSSDVALEHLNISQKAKRRLMGIIQNDPARDRWLLTTIERRRLADDARQMIGLSREGNNQRNTIDKVEDI